MRGIRGGAVVVLVAATACGAGPAPLSADRFVDPDPFEPRIERPTRTAVETASPVPTLAPEASPKPRPARYEIPQGHPVPAGSLLVATKDGRTVTVAALDMTTEDETVVLTYTESAPADHSGNYWDERPPSVALSPDREELALGSGDGLFLMDVRTGTTRALIARVTEPNVDNHGAPGWSVDLPYDTFALVTPVWSPDGRYLAFEEVHYEGSTFGFYDVRDEAYFSQRRLPYSYAQPSLGAISWSPASATTVVPGNGVDEVVGLYVSEPGDPTRCTLIDVGEVDHLGAAAPGPDGARIAFTSGSTYDAFNRLAIVQSDGDIRTIDDEGLKDGVAFDAHGDLWWVEEGDVLRWDGAGTHATGDLSDHLDWAFVELGDERITLAGRSRDLGIARFVAVDPVTGERSFRHDSPTDYTTYLGIA